MENKTIGFLLEGIKTEQFAVFKENYTLNENIGLSTEFEFKLDQNNKKIGVFVNFEFLQNTKTFIKIVVSCHFKINDDSWRSFIDKKVSDNQFIISKGFITHLAMISVGTTRGILYAKTEGTDFAKFIIPTINLSELILEDAVFDLM